MSNKKQIRCCACGKFISYDDLYEGVARAKQIDPENDIWEYLCRECTTNKEL